MSQPGLYRFGNCSNEVDVEFPTMEESSVEHPNPDYLKVHAAFAKLLHLRGAVLYVDGVELEAQMDGPLCPNGEMDYALKLLSKLAIISQCQCEYSRLFSMILGSKERRSYNHSSGNRRSRCLRATLKEHPIA